MKIGIQIFLQKISLRDTFLIILFTTIFVTDCKKKKEPESEAALPKIWVTQLPAETYYCSPALSTDEQTLYIGTSTSLLGIHNKSQFFIALDVQNGEEKWRIQLGLSEVRSAPAVSPDNSVYFILEVRDPVNGMVTGDELWHISSQGDLLWKYDINPDRLTIDVGLSVPAIGPDGTVYAGGDRLYAINSDGTLKWTFSGEWPEAIRNAPAIGKDGTVYFVYHNVPLTALSPEDGSVKWSLPLGVNDHCFSSPAIGVDGNLYVATQPGILYAVSHEGLLLWTFDIATAGFSGTFRSSPSVGSDGSIYFGLNNGSPSSAFFAINSDGTLKWIFTPEDLPDNVPRDHFDIYSSPAIGSDGLIYFGQEFGRVYALKASDGSLVAMTTTTNAIIWSSPAIDKEGVLYINDLNGNVHAIRTGSKGLDPSAYWPKFRYDNQNGGWTRYP